MIQNVKRPGTMSSLIVRKWNLTFNKGYDLFVLAHKAEQVSFLPYPGSKRSRTDWVNVMKSRPHLIDVPHQDDKFQENMDIHEGSTIDVMIEDVGPLVHESHLSEELDIAVETYFEEVKNDETEIEWDSDKGSNQGSDEETNEYSNIASSNNFDKDSNKYNIV
ncbi:hypothetical protein M9H77_35509 [Catharanthus roseus]|uniref:Uncharacterized protein n=1 Tax=Catharanthus roseus TaxID=4058 RepID=A0ACB9ZP75_CATRO|nr:hypothetical protein M9H77_35509 [Catharanthus roseus]